MMAAILASAAMLCGQTPAEVRYLDGSVVRMTLDQPNIELQTKYGKLTIPLSDVRRLDVGVHLSASERREVDLAIERLSDNAYKSREEAKAWLIAAGANAYAVVRSHKPIDLEQGRRQDEVVKALEEKLTKEVLGRQPFASVQTAEFTAIGKLLCDEIPAKSANFGKSPIRLSSAMSIVIEQRAAEVQIDAESYSSEKDSWLDTGVSIGRDMTLIFSATGLVDLWYPEAGKYVVSPRGYTGNGRNSSYAAGALIAKIGNGQPFVVGESSSVWSNTCGEGRLYLQVVTSPWGDVLPRGKYQVKIKQSYTR